MEERKVKPSAVKSSKIARNKLAQKFRRASASKVGEMAPAPLSPNRKYMVKKVQARRAMLATESPLPRSRPGPLPGFRPRRPPASPSSRSGSPGSPPESPTRPPPPGIIAVHPSLPTSPKDDLAEKSQPKVYVDIFLQSLFKVHLFIRSPFCSRLMNTTTRMYTTRSGLEIPIFQVIFVLEKYWSRLPVDDRNIGSLAFSILDYRPIQKSGILLHCLQTFVGHCMERDVEPSALMATCRLLFKHMKNAGVESTFIQGISQGLWSKFKLDNRNVRPVKVRFRLPPGHFPPAPPQGSPSPVLIFNFEELAKAPDKLSLWKAIKAMILTAIRYDSEKEVNVGLYLESDPLFKGIHLSLDLEASPPNSTEVESIFKALESTLIFEIVTKDETLSSVSDLEGFTSRCSAGTRHLRAPSDRDSIVFKTNAIRSVFRRVVASDRLMKNINVTDEDISQLRSTRVDYRRFMLVLEAGLRSAFKTKKKLLIRPKTLGDRNPQISKSGSQQPSTYVAVVNAVANHNYLNTSQKDYLTLLLMDDVELPASFGRIPVSEEELQDFLKQLWKDLKAAFLQQTQFDDEVSSNLILIREYRAYA